VWFVCVVCMVCMCSVCVVCLWCVWCVCLWRVWCVFVMLCVFAFRYFETLNKREYVWRSHVSNLQLNCPPTVQTHSLFLSSYLTSISFPPTATRTVQSHCLSVTQADGCAITQGVCSRPLKVETRVRSQFSQLDHPPCEGTPVLQTLSLLPMSLRTWPLQSRASTSYLEILYVVVFSKCMFYFGEEVILWGGGGSANGNLSLFREFLELVSQRKQNPVRCSEGYWRCRPGQWG
jgi:hypothetical protein